MDSSFSLLGFFIFGICISFYAFVVQSQINGAESSPFALTMSPPPPPLLSPPPPHSSDSPPLPSPPPPPQNQIRSPRRRRHHVHSPPPPPPPHRMNAGQKVGLLFVGIAAIMQVGIVGFLVIKRRQLLKTIDRYDNSS